MRSQTLITKSAVYLLKHWNNETKILPRGWLRFQVLKIRAWISDSVCFFSVAHFPYKTTAAQSIVKTEFTEFDCLFCGEPFRQHEQCTSDIWDDGFLQSSRCFLAVFGWNFLGERVEISWNEVPAIFYLKTHPNWILIALQKTWV